MMKIKKFALIRLLLSGKNKYLTIGFIFFEILTFLHLYESFISKKEELKNAKHQASNIAILLDRETSFLFKFVNLCLDDVEVILANSNAEEFNKSSIRNDLLAKRKKLIPELLNIEVKKQSISENDKKFLTFSPLNVDEEKRMVEISRRYINKNFQGIITATIDLKYFQKLFNSLNLGSDVFVSIAGPNKILYSSKPDSPMSKQQRRIDDIIKTSGEILITISYSNEKILVLWKERFLIHLSVLIIANILFLSFFSKLLNLFLKIEEKERQSLQLSKLASLGEMSTAIAHEINNPLSIVSGQVQVLSRKMSRYNAPSPEETLANFEKINKNISRIVKTISSLKSFARDSYEDPIKSAGIKNLLESAVDLCQEKLKLTQTNLQILPFNDIQIECKEVQLEQVFVNLINNACDAVKDLPEKWIRIEVKDLGFEIMITIIDSGLGIPSEIRDKILEPFFTTKDIGKGTGLGLSISLGIIINHHGKLYLDPHNKNTCFVIELPKFMDFDEAISVHLEWKKKLKQYIKKPDGSLLAEQVCRDDLCELGRWIYGKGNIYSKIPEYSTLKHEHAKFHKIAGEIIQKANTEKNDNLEYELLGEDSKYTESSKKIVKAIMDIKFRKKEQLESQMIFGENE